MTIDQDVLDLPIMPVEGDETHIANHITIHAGLKAIFGRVDTLATAIGNTFTQAQTTNAISSAVADAARLTSGFISAARIAAGSIDSSKLSTTVQAALSDTRTPTAGSVTTSSVASSGLAPSAVTGTAVVGNDSRLTDTRVPSAGTVTTAAIASGGLAPSAIAGTAVISSDARLADTRVPTDGSVGTNKIANLAVTEGKLASALLAKINAGGGGGAQTVAPFGAVATEGAQTWYR